VGTKVPLVREGVVLSIFCRYTNSVRMIETMCKCACATVPKRFTIEDRFFSFGEDDYDELCH
jgi:hypothetical protein